MLRVRVKKSASFTRWDQRPLTDEQLSYAAEDVEHLLPLTDELQSRLDGEGPAAVGPRGVPADRRRRPTSATPRRSGAGCRARAGSTRASARSRASWPPGASARPSARTGRSGRCCATRPSSSSPSAHRATAAALGSIRGLTPDVGRRRGDEIIEAIERGREAEPIRLDREERWTTESGDGPVIALAEALVRTRAIEAGLAYELIAARADLTPVVVAARRGAEPPAVRTLEGWRRELVGDELLALLRGERRLGVSGPHRHRVVGNRRPPGRCTSDMRCLDVQRSPT